ncbi:hypothetical protein KQI42_16840 [Tissierella sp. MSJ-40]|uniref:Uncharacterized protein n=1 Tax=Tissierella simiarum TaxID=2841534 RepID=A0ABS6EAA3_9FIRM|nr:hypothetical protein [Tissierella simiarum]MBU5439684.1 hypothetical protein [Tissierella simiarum]
MENTKRVSIKIIKLTILVFTILIMMGLVILFIRHIEMMPYYFKHQNEIILLLSMYICYLWSDKYKIKKIKTLAAVGVILGMINLVGFRLINLIIK